MAVIDDINKIIVDKDTGISPYYKTVGKNSASEEHKIVYDSPSETLEPVYYWVLDMMNAVAGKTEKLVDSFASSVGSGHFSELMGKATRMQEEVMKIMGTTNTIIKSIINLIYDLKEWEIRLDMYEKAKSEKPSEKEAAVLGLKQIWMDNVDIKRGRGSINMMAQDLQFVTLRNGFMAAKSAEDVDKLDLNDIVKRVLKPRIQEFFEWKERSEVELNKRYNIEISYLKSQVNALKMYTRWAKPYLKAAAELEQKDMGRNPALVNAFSTIVLELAVMGKREIDVKQEVYDKVFPRAFESAKARKYFACVLVDFRFRGIPGRAGQNYVYGGRVEVTFRGYGLNEDEIAMLESKMDESDFKDALKLVQGMTDESLGELKKEIDNYLEEADKKEKQDTQVSTPNPFKALFGMAEKKEKKEEKKKITEVKKDSYVESVIRERAIARARGSCFTIFDVYKKAHGMASHPNPFD